ncbi:MAG: WD40/YVTN/BNR-like repeat-containing protein [Planctomycetota bacterium]
MNPQVWIATRKGLFQLQRGAKAGSWKIARSAFLGDPVHIVLPVVQKGKLTAVFAALGHEHFGTKIHRSTDGGKSWEQVGVPAYPKPKKGEKIVHDPIRNRPIEWVMRGVWALETGHPSNPQRLWCGTLPGGLFRSDDFGKTWKLTRSLWDRPERAFMFGGGKDWPGIHSICIHPTDPKKLAVAFSGGGVWRSDDDGKSWRCDSTGIRNEYMPPGKAYDPVSQDPHRMVQCPVEPNTFWIQHHNGIFHSVDGADSFREVKEARPSVFGFAVAVHPKDPKTAWFVPGVKDEKRFPVDAKVVVSRTRDGGKSFDILRQGLPQEQAYDVVYRHALDVDGSGEKLCFGSTTGNLWASENGGERWQTISTSLPPIYAVRFVK